MASTSQTSSTSAHSAHPYDGLLSFRGELCKDFAYELCYALQERGITVFMDHERTATSILTTTTKQSRFAIVVLSPEYASSTFCLDKLSSIMGYMRGTIFPVFYEVKPSDLRKQEGCLKSAFDMHERVEDPSKMEGWRTALRKVACVSGWTSKHGDSETKLIIKEIVEHCYSFCDVIHDKKGTFIPANKSSQIENGKVEHPFLPQNDCPRCCGCSKKWKPGDTAWLQFDDGLSLCTGCQESAIKVTEECQSPYLDHHMKLEHQHQNPLQLVGRHSVGKYNVLLSFSGETCKDFIDHLYKALQERGISVYRDDEHTDTFIPSTANNSRFAIIVLSPEYVLSDCCFDKLRNIFECMQGRILPIFFNVETSILRKKNGFARTGFDMLDTEDMGKLEWWTTAPKEVADIAGWVSTDWEAQLVKEIVAECSKLRCDVCHDWKSFIPADSSQAEYVEHPFWGQNYCPSHEGTTRKCCSCERLEPKDTKYFVLDDGRHLCPECQESAIMDSDQCQSLYLEVQKFYEDHDMKLGHQIRLQLVGRQKLNRVMKGDQSNCDGEIRAVCLEAKEILIWYGLPRLLTGSILAQEMIKAWLMLQVYPHFKLSAEVERCICGVLAYSWLEYYSSDPDSSKIWSDFEKKLVEFIKHQIESSDYGEAFRKATKVVHEYGLCTSAIEHIVRSMYFKVVKQLQYTSISAPSASTWKYDVFLSFRGETRMGFTSRLDKALKMGGINVFTDSLIKRGASIPATLLTAILKSRFAIIVLSQNYTSSMWCLDEVTKALQCMDKRSAVFPIFYLVGPSDVRHDTMGVYQRHNTRRYIKKTTVQDWKMSVCKVTNVSGWVSSGSRQEEDEIITDVVNELRNRVVCAGCNRRINYETSYLRCNHRVWHQECFR